VKFSSGMFGRYDHRHATARDDVARARPSTFCLKGFLVE
jgi:hypothetical protein